jgi:hypothetical protein
LKAIIDKLEEANRAVPCTVSQKAFIADFPDIHFATDNYHARQGAMGTAASNIMHVDDEPLLNGSIIQLDTCDLPLERAEPSHDFVELAINAVETIVKSRETSAQEVENVAGFTYVSSPTTSVPHLSARPHARG